MHMYMPKEFYSSTSQQLRVSGILQPDKLELKDEHPKDHYPLILGNESTITNSFSRTKNKLTNQITPLLILVTHPP